MIISYELKDSAMYCIVMSVLENHINIINETKTKLRNLKEELRLSIKEEEKHYINCLEKEIEFIRNNVFEVRGNGCGGFFRRLNDGLKIHRKSLAKFNSEMSTVLKNYRSNVWEQIYLATNKRISSSHSNISLTRSYQNAMDLLNFHEKKVQELKDEQHKKISENELNMYTRFKCEINKELQVEKPNTEAILTHIKTLKYQEKKKQSNLDSINVSIYIKYYDYFFKNFYHINDNGDICMNFTCEERIQNGDNITINAEQGTISNTGTEWVNYDIMVRHGETTWKDIHDKDIENKTNYN